MTEADPLVVVNGSSPSDPVEEKESEIPASVLSSSQLNALAVSVFLALNIGVPKPPLSVAMLDDPLQSLDDVNLLGLVDLFRRTRGRRQLIVSTHDGRFGNLLCRKLRPTTDDSRTMVIELDGWSRQGPSVTVREIMRDPVALRLGETGRLRRASMDLSQALTALRRRGD